MGRFARRGKAHRWIESGQIVSRGGRLEPQRSKWIVTTFDGGTEGKTR